MGLQAEQVECMCLRLPKQTHSIILTLRAHLVLKLTNNIYLLRSGIANYLSIGQILEQVVSTVACGGNVLINIGSKRQKASIYHPEKIIFIEREIFILCVDKTTFAS